MHAEWFKNGADNMIRAILRCADLKSEGLVEDGTEVLALDFGLKLLLLVWQHIDFDVGVRGPAHVHRRQVLSLEDADYELEEERG